LDRELEHHYQRFWEEYWELLRNGRLEERKKQTFGREIGVGKAATATASEEGIGRF